MNFMFEWQEQYTSENINIRRENINLVSFICLSFLI